MCNPAGCLLSRYCFFVLARSLSIKLAGYISIQQSNSVEDKRESFVVRSTAVLSQYFAPDFEHRAQMRWQATSFRGVI